VFSAEGIAWLAANYPLLATSSSKANGRIHFRMLYKAEAGYVIEPTSKEVVAGEGIFHEDDYEVQIFWPIGSRYPLVKAADQKIASVRTAKRLSTADIHLHLDGKTLCLATPQELELTFADGFDIKIYFNRFLIPYLFLQTHYRKTGKWLWATAGHGLVGVLEWYESAAGAKTREGALHTAKYFAQINAESLLIYRPKGRDRCICGRAATMQKCHPKAFKTLRELYTDLKSYGVGRPFWERLASYKGAARLSAPAVPHGLAGSNAPHDPYHSARAAANASFKPFTIFRHQNPTWRLEPEA
jgi:hypothetical protein